MDTDQVGQRLEVVYCKGWFGVQPLLFIIFIDDIDEVLCEISKFTNDTKITS